MHVRSESEHVDVSAASCPRCSSGCNSVNELNFYHDKRSFLLATGRTLAYAAAAAAAAELDERNVWVQLSVVASTRRTRIVMSVIVAHGLPFISIANCYLLKLTTLSAISLRSQTLASRLHRGAFCDSGTPDVTRTQTISALHRIVKRYRTEIASSAKLSRLNSSPVKSSHSK